MNVVATAQPGSAHAAAIEDVGERAFDDLGAQLERRLRHPRQQPRPVVVDGAARVVVAVPARDPLALALGLGDPRLPGAVLEGFEHRASEVTLVGHQLRRGLRRRRRVHRRQVGLGRRQRRRQGGGVALVGGMQFGGDHRPGVEIDRVLRLVGEMGGAVLHLGDPGVRVGLGDPVRVRQLLALACPVDAHQILRRRRLDPAFHGHPLEHLPIALAGVPAHDRAQRRVGLHRRGVDADPIALDQPVLVEARQHPAEHLGVDLVGKATAGLRKPRMVRNPLALLQAQELPQRQAVGAPPLDPALRIDAFEIADQVHPEVPPRRDRRRPHPRRVIGRAQLLGKTIEIGVDQNPLKPIIENVARRPRHLRPRHHQFTLSIPLPSQRHTRLR